MSKKTSISLNVLRFADGGCHVTFEGKLKKQKINILIDTGASCTVLDSTFANTYFKNKTRYPVPQGANGVGAEVMNAEAMKLKKLKAGTVKIKKLQVAVVDLTNVNQLYSQLQLPPIHLILGGDILDEHRAILNYKKRKLKISK
jgi:predicted aspartyl protease